MQTIPAWEEDDCGTGQLGRAGGFSLHGAGGGEHAGAQEAGAYLPDYLSPGAVRGTIGADRPGYGQLWLENSLSGWDYWAAIRHVLFERGGLAPLDFMAKLAALVPKPRTNLTGPPRYRRECMQCVWRSDDDNSQH